VTKTPVVTESAKRRLERAVRMRESLSNISNFFIYLYCERKASEIENSYFISLDAQKCEEEDAEFDVYIKTHFKGTERFHYKYFSSCHPAGVIKGFIKGETFRLLQTN